MALDTAFYLVSADIAKRSGLYGKRYIAPDGRFILDNKDLSRVRFTTDEYINGLSGVERIPSQSIAQSLIAAGGYNMTPPKIARNTSHDVEVIDEQPEQAYEPVEPVNEPAEVVEEPAEESTEEPTENDNE